MIRQLRYLGLVGFGVSWFLQLTADQKLEAISFFETNIRPVLAESCYRCHSEAKKKAKGGLTLDSAAALMRGGESGAVIDLSEPDHSLLLKALTYQDPDLQMPPDEPLSDKVVADFATWIKEGAVFPESSPRGLETRPPWWETIAPESILSLSTSVSDAIDHYVDLGLAAQGLQASPPVNEAKRLRRLSLDLLGRPPTPPELTEYVFDSDLDRTVQAVDRMIRSTGFVRHQTEELHWQVSDGIGKALRRYLESQIKEGMRWDRMFEDIILANYQEASTKGAAEFIQQRIGDIDRLTNDVSVRFFGVNISCAQCHDHPSVGEWTQDRYYGMKSFFNRTFENGGFVGEKSYGKVVYKTSLGESQEAPLQFLVGSPIDEPPSEAPSEAERKEEKRVLDQLKKEKKPVPPPAFSRRAALVETGLHPERVDYFSRAIVNRIWQRFMGRGLVEPLDQMHGDNTPSHPALLVWLSRYFTDSGFDLRELIRGLVLSQAYQRSSQQLGSGMAMPESYAVFNTRPLSPKQYAATLRFGSISPDRWSHEDMRGDNRETGLESIVAESASVAEWFERAGEDFYFNVDEALLLSNGSEAKSFLFRGGENDLVTYLLERFAIHQVDEATREAYRVVLNRVPSAEERIWVEDYLRARRNDLKSAWQQVIWALLTSAENRFNH